MPLKEVIEIDFRLEQKEAHYKQKAEKFSLPDHQLAENVILIFVPAKG